jgi:hypothetical protein
MPEEQFSGGIFPGVGAPILPVKGHQIFIREIFPLAWLRNRGGQRRIGKGLEGNSLGTHSLILRTMPQGGRIQVVKTL